MVKILLTLKTPKIMENPKLLERLIIDHLKLSLFKTVEITVLFEKIVKAEELEENQLTEYIENIKETSLLTIEALKSMS